MMFLFFNMKRDEGFTCFAGQCSYTITVTIQGCTKAMWNSFYIISWIMCAVWLVLSNDLFYRIDIWMTSPLTIFCLQNKWIPCSCDRVIDHRRWKNVVRTSETHSALPGGPLFCSYHILNKYTATWNLFVKFCLQVIRFCSNTYRSFLPLELTMESFIYWTIKETQAVVKNIHQ